MFGYNKNTKNAKGFENHVWQIRDVNTMSHTRVFNTIEIRAYLPSKQLTRTFVGLEMNDWVHIYAKTSDGKILFVKQHRIGSNEVTYELPAGTIEEGEDALDAAKRELLEETGYTSNDWHYIGKYSVNPAIQTNNVYIYCALACEKASDQKLDEAEDIEVIEMSEEEFADVFEEADERKYNVTHALSQLSLLRASLWEAMNGQEEKRV